MLSTWMVRRSSLSYAYQPGEDRDGVTLKLPSSLARDVARAKVEWAVPGLRESQIAELLRALPKAIRRELMPFAPKVALIARELQPAGNSLLEDLSKFIREHFRVQVPVSAWPADALPNHLRPRIEIMGRSNHPTLAGRDLEQLRAQLETIVVKPAGDPPQWHQAVQKWEKFDLTSWSVGDLPERIHVCDTVTGPLYAWPGLLVDGQHVNLRLFRSHSEARQASLTGFAASARDRAAKRSGVAAEGLAQPLSTATTCSPGSSLSKIFRRTHSKTLRLYLLPAELPTTLTAAQFQAALQLARTRLPGLADRLIELPQLGPEPPR